VINNVFHELVLAGPGSSPVFHTANSLLFTTSYIDDHSEAFC